MKKLLLLPFFIFSCSPKSEVENLLREKDSKWIISNSPKFDHPNAYMAYMKFEEDSCRNYYMESNTPIGLSDHKGPWTYSEKDSILNMMGNIRKVTRVHGDTIFLINPDNNALSMLVKYR